MTAPRHRSLGLALGALLLSSCAPRDAGFSDVRTLVDERIGHDVRWRQLERDADLARVPQQVRRLTAQPLTPATATKIALLNNRELQGALADLGMARAALIQAGLLPNPELEAEVKFPEEGGSANLDLAASLDLTEMIFAPAARGAAERELEAAKLEAAGVVLDFAYDTQVAFYEYQGAAQQLELWRSVLAGQDAAYGVAERLYEAGNISGFDLASERSLYEEAKLALARLEAEQVEYRERLNVLMGLWGDQVEWSIEARLPDPPAQPVDVSGLSREALDNSLDLGRARERMQAAASRTGLARERGWLPELELGAVAERDEGQWAFGPRAALSVPLFDQGQGVSGMALAELEQLRERHAALAIRIRSAVRRAASRLSAARQQALYMRDVLLPLKQRIVHEAQLQYNAMAIGVFQLLQVRLDQIDAQRRYIAALRDYWVARAALDQLRAGRIRAMPDAGGGADGAMAPPRPAGGH